MRILLVSHPPVTAELGAAQIALELAAALRRRGHDAVAWSPEPLAGATQWTLWKRQRSAIEAHCAAQGPYDVVDTPAISATARLAARSCLVARSVQPELRYLRLGVLHDLRRRPSPRALLHALAAAERGRAIRAGWRAARLVLCLGSLEHEQMAARYPRWRHKLGMYVSAVPAAERLTLLALRTTRPARVHANDTRFLWLGRWSAQKGTAALLRLLRDRFQNGGGESITIAGCGPHARRDIPAAWLDGGRVRLVPSYRRDELPALLDAHDAGLFTSEVEGWGLSLAEMLEAGLPVYAALAGAVPDLLPYFPHSLRPLPPAAASSAPLLEDLEANGYLARFDWDRIAGDYEAQVVAARA
ncbi:MAG TPA: glycosyltransferase family 4 protein [Thermoanaerobaculia bacterium]|nr:glycosyltransferase family 4 protein [Thermoanaerobaculia bacterium]